MMSRRTSGGFSCFTIDALIGNLHDSPPPPPPVTDSVWLTSSDYTSPSLQYVVSCSRLEDVRRSPPPSTTTTTLNLAGQNHQQDDDAGGSRHAFRVYRPSSLDGVVAAASNIRTPDSGQQCGILATLQRRAMRWYSDDVDNDHWRTPTLCDMSTDSRRINDIIVTPSRISPTRNVHCEYYSISIFYFHL